MQGSTLNAPQTEVKSKRQTTPVEKEEMLGTFAAMLMYIVWLLVYGLVSGSREDGYDASIVVFLIVLTQFFMSYVPDLRKDKLNWKVALVGWLLLPMAWSAIAAALMGLMTRYLMPLIRGLIGE